MAELFGKAKSTITEHINNVFAQVVLEENSVVRDFRTTASDGKNYCTVRCYLHNSSEVNENFNG